MFTSGTTSVLIEGGELAWKLSIVDLCCPTG